jgi:hypothetical protein
MEVQADFTAESHHQLFVAVSAKLFRLFGINFSQKTNAEKQKDFTSVI